MAEKYMYIKMTKGWGGFKVGDIVRFGWNKGEAKIKANVGVQVPKQRAVNDPQPLPKEKPKVETATAEPMLKDNSETAEVTPGITEKQINTSFIDGMNKKQLIDYADKNSIDLGDAKNKSEIKDVIIQAIKNKFKKAGG